MKEIKFRGKDNHTKEWAYGSYVTYQDRTRKGSPTIHAIIDKRGNWSFVDPETVGQYTGIKDRNGKEIYFKQTLRFVDKVEWYRGEFFAKVALGTMTRQEALDEIDKKPYEERIVEGIQDYEWLLSSEIKTYWEIV